MRKLTLGLAILLLTISSSLVSGQENPEVFVRTVPIIKILSHQLGYKIYHLTVTGDMESFHVPVRWFTTAGGKGSITYGTGAKYPYFSIYWVDNEFSHIKLFLRESLQDDSWGILSASHSEVQEQFAVEEPQIQF